MAKQKKTNRVVASRALPWHRPPGQVCGDIVPVLFREAIP
jgi:hypothetical protein